VTGTGALVGVVGLVFPAAAICLIAAPYVERDLPGGAFGAAYAFAFLGLCACWIGLSVTTFFFGRPRFLVPPAFRDARGR
jgi:hypothetical protein